MKVLDRDNNLPKVAITAEAIVILLALASLFLFAFELFGDPSEAQKVAIRYADLSIAFVFLLEFSFRFLKEEDKKSFLWKKWWQLLAALPVTSTGSSVIRGLQLIRLAPILRLAVIALRTKVLFRTASTFIHQTYLASILLFVIFLIIGGTFSFFLIESEINPGIETLMDSLWWTISSMTTTGVETEPVSGAGRVIGILLMLCGVVTLGVFTASIASYFINKRRG